MQKGHFGPDFVMRNPVLVAHGSELVVQLVAWFFWRLVKCWCQKLVVGTDILASLWSSYELSW